MTLNQLRRRGWSLTNKCLLCYAHEESSDHILLRCGKVRALWKGEGVVGALVLHVWGVLGDPFLQLERPF